MADGRSFAARSREKHDLIFSALTQSATGSRAGIALAESYIHTREAFQVYLDHLTEEGIYALVVQEEPVLVRAFLTAVSVLAERGASVPEACRHLVAAMIPREMHPFTPYRRILLVRRSPFTPADSERVLEGIRSLGVHSLFVPHLLEEIPPFADLASGKQSLAEYIAEYEFGGTPLNVAPRTDDQPFFLDLSPTMPPVLIRLLWGIGLVTLFAGAWLAFRRRREGPGAPLRSASGALYFALLGAGFMLLEVPFIQQFILFLGHPVLSLTLVLFALLLGTAAGSRRSQRWNVSALPARVFAAACGIVLLALLYRALLPGLFALPYSRWSFAAPRPWCCFFPRGCCWGCRYLRAFAGPSATVRTRCRGCGGSTASRRCWAPCSRWRWRGSRASVPRSWPGWGAMRWWPSWPGWRISRARRKGGCLRWLPSAHHDACFLAPGGAFRG